jgi:Pilin accessory protein (PilO)
MSDTDFEDDTEQTFGGGDDESPKPTAARPPTEGGGVVKVKGKEFAVGLFWSAIEEIPQANAEAKAAAAREGTTADFYCVRLSGNAQYGLGRRADGHRAGMPSLAAAVADNRQGSWIGCFLIGEGYYLIAVRDDGIFPGTDRYYLSEDDARSEFERVYAIGEWEGTFAPPAFGYPEAKEMPINNLLIGKPSVRLSDVSGRSRKFFLFGGLILAMVAVFGGFRYYAFLAEQASEASLRAMRDAGNRNNPLRQKIEIPPMPWEGRVQGAVFMEKCQAGIKNLQKVEFPGWKIGSYYCTNGDKAGPKTVAVDLQRDGAVSSINWIKYAMDKSGYKPGVTPVGAQGALVTLPMDPVPAIAIDVQTAKIPDMQRFLISQFDERLTRIDLAPGEHNQFVTGLRLSFKTQVSPLSFDDILKRIPALVISKMTYDSRTWIWTIEGVTYEQHIPANAKPRK